MLATTEARDVARVLLQRRDVIRSELRRLDDALGFYEPPKRENGTDARPSPSPKGVKLPGPSQAVLTLLSESPGLPLKDVVNGAIERGVRSRAKDQKHMIRNTVDVLLRRGTIQRLDGKLYPLAG